MQDLQSVLMCRYSPLKAVYVDGMDNSQLRSDDTPCTVRLVVSTYSQLVVCKES